MIKFINGGVNTDREELMLDEIHASVSKDREVIVIIPDQYSFEYDKKLYNRLGAVKFNKITTAGFNRLAELLRAKYGCNSSGIADDNSKMILMYKAVKKLRNRGKLGYYKCFTDKNGIEKGNFISQLIDLIQQLRESGISPEILKTTVNTVNSTLAQKMTDISAIYAEYINNLDEAELQDSVSSISSSVKIARENDFFSGKDVFVDSFSSFTYDELQMLELCILKSANVVFSFVIDEVSVKNSVHPFRLPLMTFGELKNLAKNKEVVIVSTTDKSIQSPEISYLGKSILSVNKKPYNGSCNNIRVLRADDDYSEASFVCAQIRHLVEKGSSYSDFSIIVRNLEDCASIFEGMLERYEIPYFIDQHERISSSAIVQYFNAVFKCLTTKSFKTENILKMIKSPFYTTKKYLVNELELYCLKWNIDGDMWQKEYFGLANDMIDNNERTEINSENTKTRYIDLIEKARKNVIIPLNKMKQKCANGEIAASEMCESFFELLNDLNVSDRTYSVVKNATLNDNETQIELSRDLRQTWNYILGAVKSMYDCLKNDKISLRQFYELYKVMLSQMSVSDPPQKLDCVRIVDASHSRLSDVKTAFICQVNDGVFPKAFANNSLLSHIDVSQLQSALKSLDGDLIRSFRGDSKYTFMREELACYNAVSVPTQKLFVTYVTADLSGSEKRPSPLIKEITDCFADFNIENISDISKDFFCTSYKTAYHTAVENYRDNSTCMESIKMSLGAGVYSQKLSDLVNADRRIKEDKTSVDSETAAAVFFKDSEMYISASQIDSYYKCPFSYFCRYGLRLRPADKIELNSIQRGIIIHKVLEVIFSIKDDNGNLVILNCEDPDSFINNTIDKCFSDYYVNVLKSDFGKTKSFLFDYNRLKILTARIVKYVRDELFVSHFRPCATEYKFGNEEGNTRIEFFTESGKKLSINGFIDRIDICHTNNADNAKYVRVIDYKTGKIQISYPLLQCGLDLQMLVYLDAYLRTEEKNGVFQPAAVEYFSFGEKAKYPSDKQVDEEQAEKIVQEETVDKYKPKGLVADVDEIIKAFGRSDGAKPLAYAPFAEKTGKIPYDELQALREYARDKTIEFANSVESGQFPMRPVTDRCSYCDYKAVCGKDKYDDFIDPGKIGNELTEKLKTTLAKIIEKQNKEES